MIRFFQDSKRATYLKSIKVLKIATKKILYMEKGRNVRYGNKSDIVLDKNITFVKYRLIKVALIKFKEI